MRLSFLVERPTQFEAPFFRHAAADAEHHLRVIYGAGSAAETTFDPELGRAVSWGFDLLAGYDHAFLPAADGGAFWRRELAGCDLLIINGYTQRAYRQAATAAHRAGVPAALRLDSVLWGHGAARRLAKRLLFALYLRRRFRLFLGVGSLTRDYLRAMGVPAARIGLFPYAVDHARFRAGSRREADERRELRQKLELPAAGPVVLAVAKLNPREAPWDLLRALVRLPSPLPWVAIAGDGPERPALEAFAAGHGLERVRFLGYWPYAELARLYGACDLFVHAAQEERWGVSVAEAMACGLPVIASSRVGAGVDLIAAGENGERYPSGDAAALAAALRAILGRLQEAAGRAAVDARNQTVLASWGYEASWRGILEAAGRLSRA